MQVIKAMAKEIISARLEAFYERVFSKFFFYSLNNVHPCECVEEYCFAISA